MKAKMVKAIDLRPGMVVKTKVGPYRIDWIRHSHGGVELHSRTLNDRTLWHYESDIVKVIGTEPVVPSKDLSHLKKETA